MITIQKNLNDFIEQIESLADKIIACNDEDKLYVYLKTYKTLCYLYGLNEKCRVYVEEIENNNFYKDFLLMKSDEYFMKNDRAFLKQKGELEQACLKSLFPLIDVLDKFSASSYYKKNNKLYNKKLNSEELYDILINYLKEENKEMLSIFLELSEEKRFYRLNNRDVLKSNGLSIFNALNKKTSILIRRNLVNLRFLEAYVHEIAHAFDFATLLKKSDEFTVLLYSSNSVLNETISTAYSIDLYDYLIRNSLYKDYSVIELANTLLAYSYSLDTASLICALTEEDYFQLVNSIPKKKDIINLLRKHNPNFPINEDLLVEYCNEDIDICETIQYSYGYLLSKTLLSDKNNFSKFLELSNKNPSIMDLKDEGFDLNASSKVLIKHLEEYLD